MIAYFLKKDGQGDRKKYRPYRGVGVGQAAVQGVNQLNQAQCGRGAQTECYLNR